MYTCRVYFYGDKDLVRMRTQFEKSPRAEKIVKRTKLKIGITNCDVQIVKKELKGKLGWNR